MEEEENGFSIIIQKNDMTSGGFQGKNILFF